MGRIRAGFKFNVGKHGRVYVPVGGGGGGKKGSGKGCSWGLLKWPLLLLLLVVAIFAPKSKKDAPEPSPAVHSVETRETRSAYDDLLDTPEPSPVGEGLAPPADSPEPSPVGADALGGPSATEAPTPEPTPEPTPVTRTYILNTGTKKFHTPGCSSVKDIKEANKQTYEGTREDLIAMGYEPCGRCHP